MLSTATGRSLEQLPQIGQHQWTASLHMHAWYRSLIYFKKREHPTIRTCFFDCSNIYVCLNQNEKETSHVARTDCCSNAHNRLGPIHLIRSTSLASVFAMPLPSTRVFPEGLLIWELRHLDRPCTGRSCSAPQSGSSGGSINARILRQGQCSAPRWRTKVPLRDTVQYAEDESTHSHPRLVKVPQPPLAQPKSQIHVNVHNTARNNLPQKVQNLCDEPRGNAHTATDISHG